MTSANHRRWFRFSLRTLFVLVTVACIWLGYCARWCQQRREALAWIDQHEGSGNWHLLNTEQRHIPWSLRIVGAKPVFTIWIGNQPNEYLEDFEAYADRICRLFPEADVRIDEYEWDYGVPRLKAEPIVRPARPPR